MESNKYMTIHERNAMTDAERDNLDSLDEFLDFTMRHKDHIRNNLKYYITRTWVDDTYCMKIDIKLMEALGELNDLEQMTRLESFQSAMKGKQ